MSFLNAFAKNLFGKGANSINAVDAHVQLDGAQAPFVLDVRQPDEFVTGHIAKAKLIPLGELAARLGELPKDRTILCVCASGMRSSVATDQLTTAGYTVLNLSGGMGAWQRASLPMVRGK